VGGLRTKIPQTYRTFAIATYAIAGLPLAAGFFSKDEILASAWATPYFPAVGKLVWLLGTVAAFCTAFYMYRLVYLTFFGEFRGTHEQEHHLHESPPSMTVPLWILAALSLFFWRTIDAIIDGTAALIGWFVAGTGDLLRFFQTGNVRNYALMFFLGVIVFIWVTV